MIDSVLFNTEANILCQNIPIGRIERWNCFLFHQRGCVPDLDGSTFHFCNLKRGSNRVKTQGTELFCKHTRRLVCIASHFPDIM